jgi:diadenylate cyclase
MNLLTDQRLLVYWKPVVEILVFWYLYYALLKFLRTTGALQVLKGVFFLVVFFLTVQLMGLETIARLISYLLPISVIGFVVIFQGEIRRGLTRIGQNPMFKAFLKEEKIIDEIVKAATGFSRKRIGALIALEREISLNQYAETGVPLDAILNFELLSTLFIPGTPLHDGGVIVRSGRIEAAACLFPLSQSQKLPKEYGTRHRAALGLSEETDAVAIVVSEETGLISIAEKGEFEAGITPEELRSRLSKMFKPTRQIAKGWLTASPAGGKP